ncbi:MAG: T9SS type A sorting domain-containing protein, partial [Prevotellaceae bacterium]|nr:T9SS type A sorting domain-containing protein [Prevotellaceae bacterium]
DITLPSAYNASDGKITITPSGGASPYSYSWDYNNSTSNPLTNIPARNNPYKVKVTDKNQCSVELNPRVIYKLAVKITVENSIPCYGRTGTLKATGTGGVGTNYTYQWYRISGNQKTPCGTGALLSGASAGKYSVTVTDTENNKAQSSDFDLIQPAQLNAGYTVTIPSAHNVSDGKIEISPSGGTGAYTYKLNGNQVINPVTGLSARENPYTVTVTDANLCSVELKPRIIYPLGIKIKQATPIACYGGKGVLQAVAVGGVGTNYSYQWYSVNQDNTETKISSATNATLETTTGKYRVKVTDKENVSATSGIFEFSQPDLLTAEYTVAQPSAYNAADGTITVVPSGGIPPYSYTLDGVSVTNPVGGISAKSKPYVVTVIDAKGCTKTLDKVYAFYYPMEVTIVEDKAIKCFGEKGELKAEVTGGADKTYNWYIKNTNNIWELLSSQTSATLTNIAGTYRVRVKDSNDTIKYKEFELVQPTKFTAKFEKQLPSAYNASDGAILILPYGGVIPYSYSWDYNNSTANPLENIPARDAPYKVTVSDANGCSEMLDIEMIYPLEVKAEITAPILCHNGTGTLTATATGGVGKDYSYEWYRVEDVYYEEPLHVNNAVLTNVSVGKYRVKATDRKNTTAVSETIDLIQPDKLTAEYEIILPTAYDASDGKITITTEGGIAPYSYSWEYNNSTANPIENIPANDNPYKVRITDANGCYTTLEPRIIYPLSVEIAITDSISCFGGVGTLKATATGGVGKNYSYKWYKINNVGTAQLLPAAENNSILTNALTGVYQVEVTDIENNLEQSGNLTLPQPTRLTAAYKVTLPSTYNTSDGKITVTPSGGVPPYSYSWVYNNSKANPLEDIPANDNPYTVTVTDAKGCSVTLDDIYVIYYPVTVEIAIDKPVSCYGYSDGKLRAIAAGGITANRKYQWYRVINGNTQIIPDSTNVTLSNTGTGIYRVRTTDMRDSTVVSENFEFTQPDLLTAKYDITPPAAYNSSDGIIKITPSGGTVPYFYKWDYKNLTSNPLEKLSADDKPYTVEISDSRGCMETLHPRVLYYPMEVKIVQEKPVSCYGENDGKLRATATGGVTANRTYKWSKIVNNNEITLEEGENIDTLENVGEGVYRVEVTDVQDSIALSEYIEIVQPDLLTAEETITLPATYNASDGKIEIMPNGGTAPYFYKWDYDNSTANPLENIPANDSPYKVTVTDSRGCLTILSPRVIYPLAVEITLVDSISCYLGSDGTLKATATGGVGINYSYKWHKIELGNDKLLDANGNTLSGVDAGKYYVEATDIEGNKASSAYFEFNHPEQLKIDYEVILTSSADASDGKIETVISGGVPGYSYLWDYQNNITGKLTDLPSGQTVYKLTVTDSRGCQDSIRTRLVYPLKVNISVEDSISCYGNADGRLKANAVGGLSKDYEYQWYKLDKGTETVINSATGEELTAAGAGIYRVRVTGLEENTAFADLTFNSPDLLVVTPDISMPSAYNASDGVIELTVKGGTPGYSYAWNYNYATGDRLAGVPANDEPYTVTVRDTRNCAATIAPRIIYPLEIKIVVDDSISCYGHADGRLRAVATGGVGVNYSYQWYKVENGTDILLSGENAVTLSGVGKGVYRVQATDIENNSTVSKELAFNQPDLLTADYSITMPSAYNASDGAVRLTVRGGTPGYSYAWNYNNATGDRLSGIPANDEPYTVTVRDTRNCTVTVAPRIIYPLEVKIVVDDSISCYGRADGRLRAVATGGVGVNYSYQWYKVENGADILLSGENAVTLSEVGEGVYRILATDVENNTSTTILTFNQPGLLDANIEYLRSALSCKFGANGSVQLSVSGGVTPYAYLWQDGAVTSCNSSLTEGIHAFEVTDRRGCKYSGTATISSPDELILKSFHIPPKAYNSDDASVWVEAVGGTSPYKYVWKGRSETTASIGGIMFGEYTVTVTDANGCTKEITEEIPNPPLLEASVTETKSVTCNGRNDGALTVVSQGGVGEHYYTWYRVTGDVLTELVSTKDIDNLPAGTYRVRVVDDNGIVAYSEDFTLVEPPLLTVLTTTSGVTCNDAAGWVEATVAGGTAPYSYLWTSGHNTARVENLAGDKYLVFVTDARECEVKGVAEVRLSPNMTIETTVVQPVCANDGSIVLNVKGGIAPYTYLWNDGSTEKQRDNLSAGVYSVTVSGANECTQYVQIRLETPEPHIVNLDEDITLCKGQQIELNVTDSDSKTQYKWYRDGKLFASTPVVELNEQGFYNVETITPQGCRSEGSINISVVENEISADFTVATKAIRNEIVRLVNISYPSPENVEWIIPEDPRIEVVEKTDEYIDLIFDENDAYSIGISSTVGACQKTVYKDVKILNRGDVPEYVLEEDAFLKSFIAYPNPNTGEFTAKIELSEIANIHLRLISIAGSIVDERDAKNNNSYEILYNIANLQGVYILQLISSKANTSLNLIINGY